MTVRELINELNCYPDDMEVEIAYSSHDYWKTIVCKDVKDVDKVFVGTFHSFGLKIIRENLELLNLDRNFTILDSDDVLSIIKKILKDNHLDPKQVSPSFIKNRISFFAFCIFCLVF